ncbi:MAG: hypothetical protein LC754_08880 [Acidobacteria bacterium]|nr:hypothetical protein [Acidobacteriota bacterium]
MGRALAALIWIMTLLSIWLFLGSGWWFPPSISEHGPAYDSQFLLTIIVVGVAFAAAQIGLGYAVWRYRDTGDGTRAVYTHGNNRIEMLGVIITAVVFIALAIKGQFVWAHLHFESAPAGASQVRVTAQQFQWNFHYAGADGKFGHTDPVKISDESLNFIGLEHYKMKSFMLVLPENEFNELMLMPQAQFQSRVTQLLNKYPISYEPR